MSDREHQPTDLQGRPLRRVWLRDEMGAPIRVGWLRADGMVIWVAAPHAPVNVPDDAPTGEAELEQP